MTLAVSSTKCLNKKQHQSFSKLPGNRPPRQKKQWTQLYLHTKTAKNIKREENYRTIFIMNIDKRIFNNIVANQVQLHIKRLYTMTKWDLSPECENGSP